MYRILAAEDSPAILNLIRISLTDAGYQCVCAADGTIAADLLEQELFDLALLDIMLPGADGYELLEYCRELGVPVIFLTAKSDLQDKVKGLRLGAEDYLTKPFEILELLARVETVLRRYGKETRLLKLYDVEADTLSHTVKRNGAAISLTNKEYEVLLLFLRNPGIALFRERIYELVRQEEFTGDSRTVDLHVQRLRKKLCWEDKITAVYKVGYRLEAPGETKGARA